MVHILLVSYRNGLPIISILSNPFLVEGFVQSTTEQVGIIRMQQKVCNWYKSYLGQQ